MSLVNTFLAMAIDVETRRPKLSNIVGGLSGPAIRPIAVRMVYECRQQIRIPIIGMGGIATAADALEFMIAGASAVQVGTANFADPLIWPKLLDGIRSYGERHGLKTIARPGRHHRHQRARERMDQLLVALDVDNAVHAIELAARLQGRVGGIKVGSTLFTAEGPALVRRLVELGHRVFLDLKFHDIPHQVAGAVAVRNQAWRLDDDRPCLGGLAMLKAARRAATEAASAANRPAPIIVAVTALTSLDDEALVEIGVSRSMERQVEELAALAWQRRSRRRRRIAARAAMLRAAISDADDRHARDSRRHRLPPDDQSRTLSAREALAAGASYLVVGRPIVAAADPRGAAEEIAATCA